MNFEGNSNAQSPNGGLSEIGNQETNGQSFISGLLTTVTDSALNYGENYLNNDINKALSNI